MAWDEKKERAIQRGALGGKRETCGERGVDPRRESGGARRLLGLEVPPHATTRTSTQRGRQAESKATPREARRPVGERRATTGGAVVGAGGGTRWTARAAARSVTRRARRGGALPERAVGGTAKRARGRRVGWWVGGGVAGGGGPGAVAGCEPVATGSLPL